MDSILCIQSHVCADISQSDFVSVCVSDVETEKTLESERADALVTNTPSVHLAPPSVCSCRTLACHGQYGFE